jgi:hypothetical protein
MNHGSRRRLCSSCSFSKQKIDDFSATTLPIISFSVVDRKDAPVIGGESNAGSLLSPSLFSMMVTAGGAGSRAVEGGFKDNGS